MESQPALMTVSERSAKLQGHEQMTNKRARHAPNCQLALTAAPRQVQSHYSLTVHHANMQATGCSVGREAEAEAERQQLSTALLLPDCVHSSSSACIDSCRSFVHSPLLS